MTRSNRLRNHLEDERRRVPGVSLQELARKFNLSEGEVLELLGSDLARRVKRDRHEEILREIRSWGPGILHIHNDWAEGEVNCDLDLLALKDGLLTLRTDSLRFRIDYARIDTVYCVEVSDRYSVQFFNRRGRCVFQVLPSAAPESKGRFERFRESFCPASTGGAP